MAQGTTADSAIAAGSHPFSQLQNYDADGRRSYQALTFNNSASHPATHDEAFGYDGDCLTFRWSGWWADNTASQSDFTNSVCDLGSIVTPDSYVMYLWGPTGPVMEFDTLGHSKALLFDPQGSCVNTTSETGLAEKPMFYDGFGEPVWTYAYADNQRAMRQPFQYKGQAGYYTDVHTDLCYCLHRFYDPRSGRWLSRDPIGLEGGVNVYEYCGGNPVMGFDPYGTDWQATKRWFFGTTFGQLFVGENWRLGTYTGASASLHVFSLGHYTNRTAKQMPGYDVSVGCATVSFEAASWALGEGAVNLGVKGLEAIKLAKAAKCMTVYRSVDAAGKVQYIGVTNSILRRAVEHAGRFTIQRISGLTKLTKYEAKAVEQCLIEYHGLAKNGGTLLNKINSISKMNPAYADSLKTGMKLLRKIKYPGF
jgi:RHS repeat-associated protein